MKKFLLALALMVYIPTVSFAYMTPQGADNFNKVFNAYHLVDIDEGSASPQYYGFVRQDGYYFIMKATISSGVTAYTFSKGTSAYSTAWTNRASETYAVFSSVFNTGI